MQRGNIVFRDDDHLDRDLQSRRGVRAGCEDRDGDESAAPAVVPAKNDRVAESLAWLERRGTQRNRDGMLRYGIIAPKAFGVSMSDIRQLSKRLGRDRDLALALWNAEWYEARLLTAFVGEPARVTASQMNQWAGDFDYWAVCDTLCFHLFDRTPHAWRKIEQWSRRRDEFVKRAATDERNFVKKGVSWAFRSIGRRNRP